MATPLLQPAFTIGEVSPSLFGREDLARLHVAAATMRNMWPSFQGGAYSRAGLEFVGFSKQTGREFPFRLVPFQFNINQGLALEFGHYYMRVISEGGYVTENHFEITGATKADPCVLTYASLSAAVSATANNGVVTASYVRGDNITIAGGSFTTAAVLRVVYTTIAAISINAAGTGYAVNDTITLQGGAAAQAAVLTVTSIGGSGAVTGVAISSGGRFTINSTTFTQASTNGSGSGATFNNALFGPGVLTIFNDGAYTSVPANPANQASTTGSGAGATFTMVWNTPSALASGDWIFVDSVVGMTELNGRTFITANVTGTTLELRDVYNNNINSTGYGTYVSGGTLARIYTLTTPYAEEDLDYLKWTQSADVMSLTCVNQMTDVEYPPQDLSRLANDDWVFSDVVTAPSVLPPTTVTAAASSGGAVTYQYQVTSIDPDDGTESVASPTAQVASAVNIAATAGTITTTWNAVASVREYNIYKATPGLSATPPVGSLFGFVGSSFGNQFIDPNITADFAQTPPLRRNPFAKGQILGLSVTNAGSGYTTAVATITSVTGSGAVLEGVIVSGAIVSWIVRDPGQNYLPTDTVAITGTGGSSATATLDVGPQDGTYPGVVTYFQQRRGYGFTLNNPDTYEFSQPGAYTNFDRRSPPIDTDAITGTPWALKVDGIQWMIPMPGGLVVLTGQSAWQLNGGGGSLQAQPLTPSSQTAQQQAYNGVSPTVPPIQILDDIVYVQSKGSIYRAIGYQINSNIYTGTDLTLNSAHLFNGFATVQHAWCEEPYKILWSIRDDGVLRSFTYLKPEQVAGWARHDTNGVFATLCSITEPSNERPNQKVDALYLGVKREIGDNTAYTIERMNDRFWSSVERVWAVDCGLELAQPEPDASLTASSADGLGAVTAGVVVDGGTGWSASTTAVVVDNNGQGTGSGAVPVLTIAGGVITAVTFAPGSQGTGYTFPELVITDPENSGGGASVTLTLDNSATFTASDPVFAVGDVGSVIRMGGGIATITAYIDTMNVTANITSPLTKTQPNSGTPPTVQTQLSGSWTMTAPRTVITGLWHLVGQEVTGVADGNVIDPQVVNVDGEITLATPASSAIVGEAFQAQFQSVYLDAGQPTIQGQRKKVAAVTARIQNSRGLKVGSNQPDGSTLSPMQIAPVWTEMVDVPEVGPNFQKKPYNATAIPLLTGDIRIPIGGGFNTRGQVALQQDYPLPMEILALIPETLAGDTPSQKMGGDRE